MAEENQGSFKVTDRRLFNPDGTLREEMVSQQAVESATAAEPRASVNQTAAKSAPESAPARGPFQDNSFVMEEQALFIELVMSLAQQAYFFLGLIPNPETGRPQTNLAAAKDTIDMLVVLHKKTMGNLTPEEGTTFDEVLAELRMRYVSLNKQMEAAS